MIKKTCYRCGKSSDVFRYGIIYICVDCFSRLFGSRRAWSSRVFARLLEGKKTFVLFSGGKDSLCALTYTIEVVKAYNVKCSLKAIHVNTGISLPGVEDYVKNVCNMLGVKLIVLKPEKSFEEYVLENGIPGRNRRWCCRVLKMEPIKKYIKRVRGEKILIDGVRRDESPRRSTRKIMTWFRYFPCPTVSPILYWTSEEVELFIRSRRLPVNPVYSTLDMSGECICGVFATKKMFLKIKKEYPQFFQRLLNVEKLVKTGWTFIYEKGRRIPLSEL